MPDRKTFPQQKRYFPGSVYLTSDIQRIATRGYVPKVTYFEFIQKHLGAHQEYLHLFEEWTLKLIDSLNQGCVIGQNEWIIGAINHVINLPAGLQERLDKTYVLYGRQSRYSRLGVVFPEDTFDSRENVMVIAPGTIDRVSIKLASSQIFVLNHQVHEVYPFPLVTKVHGHIEQDPLFENSPVTSYGFTTVLLQDVISDFGFPEDEVAGYQVSPKMLQV